MPDVKDFTAIYDRLRTILRDQAADEMSVSEEPGSYHVNTLHIMKNKQPLFFGAAKIGKRYVSYHLMPVYVEPVLLDDISPELRKRMQGKSCFNFTTLDESLVAELETLTARGLERYRAAGYV